MTTVQPYFRGHPEHVDGVMKAAFAYHIHHFREHPQAHKFTGPHRESQCEWCGRSREQVRHDDLTHECMSRPIQEDTADVLLREEAAFYRLLNKAEKEVPHLIEKLGMSGQTLATLHHTYGYTYETVFALVDLIPDHVRVEYEALMDAERERSRNAFTPNVVACQ